MPIRNYILLLLFIVTGNILKAQKSLLQDTAKTIILPASGKYYKSSRYKLLWGEHYRKEWHTPVSFIKTNIDTLAGGLIPYQTGGGRQSKSLRLRDKNDREYVLRSIDKSFGNALPEIAKGTFLESFVNDQVTIAHPYASMIVAPIAEAAGIYHTNPQLYYVPQQKALKQFNDSAGNALYLFEQRPDEDWSTAPNFGYSKNIIGTEKMLEKILEDNDHSIDQRAFVRARLFDMLIGDWGRHDDQWRWASFKEDKKTTYVPVPRDRDNAFSKFDGILLKSLIKMAHAKHLQSFDNTLKNVKTFNFPARNLDRHLTNEVTLAEWVSIANDLKKQITDNVIDDAVNHLPKEVYPISGAEIAAKLKSRLALLDTYAKDYFLFISHEVEITGTADDELFEIKRVSDTETAINIYKITNKGNVKDSPYYSRVFNNIETKEVRIYGIDGNDEFKVSGNVNKSIKLRLIGGAGKDKYEDLSSIKKNGKRTIIYDNYQNEIIKSGETKLHLSNDSSVHAYQYDFYKPNKRSFKPGIFYSNEDRIFISYTYLYQKQQWRKSPYGFEHKMDVKYSLGQQAFSSTYASTFTSLIGKWDLNLFANYDQVRWTNFYGLGNETKLTTKDRDYNRLRSRQFLAKAGIQRVINNRHKLIFNPYYQTFDIINDTARFLAKTPALVIPQTYNTHQFAGAEIIYIYQNINDSILPTKGISLIGAANFSHNIKESNRNLGKFSAELNTYLPVSKKISLKIKTGASTLSGQPEFYQFNRIGSTETLRGHQRDRFYGKSTVYNQNELRWISDVRSYHFNGKIGFFGLFDLGRVWMDNEKSNKWHNGYGAGIILSPFNRISVSVAYAISAEDKNIHFQLIKVL